MIGCVAVSEWHCTDAETLQRFRHGRDQAAFEVLVGRHVGAVRATCRRILADADLADDATQAVFILLARQADRIRDGQALSLWLQRAARTAATNIRRSETSRRRREERAGEEEARRLQQTPVVEDPDRERAAALLPQCLRTLTTKQQVAIIRHHMQGQSIHAIARDLGCSDAAVRSRVEKGLAALRRAMARHGVQVPFTGLILLLVPSAAEAAGTGLIKACATFAHTAPSAGRPVSVARAVQQAWWLHKAVVSTVSMALIGLALVTGLVAAGVLSRPISGGPPASPQPVVAVQSATSRAKAAPAIHEWERHLDSPASTELATAMLVDGEHILVAATTRGDFLDNQGLGAEDQLLVACDHDGALRWVRQFGSDVSERSVGMACDDQGLVYVLGQRPHDYGCTLTCFAKDGVERWSHAIDLTKRVTATDFACAGDRLFVGGRVLPGPQSSPWIGCFELDATPCWQRQLDVGRLMSHRRVALAAAGTDLVVAAKRTAGDGHASELVVWRFTLDGAERWCRRCPIPGGATGSAAVDVVTNGGTVIAAARSLHGVQVCSWTATGQERRHYQVHPSAEHAGWVDVVRLTLGGDGRLNVLALFDAGVDYRALYAHVPTATAKPEFRLLSPMVQGRAVSGRGAAVATLPAGGFLCLTTRQDDLVLTRLHHVGAGQGPVRTADTRRERASGRDPPPVP